MITGSLSPVTTEAMLAINKVVKALKKVPKNELAFVLRQAKEKVKKEKNHA